MRFFSFRRSAMRLVSFASMGIARGLHRSSRTHTAHRRRREQFAAWRFGSEALEGRAMMAVDLALLNDTGSNNSDGVTNDGAVDVTGIAAGNTWEYSTNSGSSWISGANNSFSLTPGSYAIGRVLVRELGGAGTPVGSAASNAIRWNIDQTAPAAPTFALASDTGSSASDGITKNGLVNVSGIETGATWEYSTDSGASWTNGGTGSSFTLPAGTYAIGSIRVRQTDLAGNLTVTPSQNAQAITVDSTDPSVLSIESDVATLGVGQTAQITFTLSEPSTDFVLNDVTVTGGRLTGFSGSGANYTATFTPTDNSVAPGKISVAANRFSDAAGNQNTVPTDLTPDLTIDSKAPTITITSSSNILTVGQTATITFTLSESSSDFGIGDITVTGGLLSGFAQDANDPLVYTATFTPALGATAGNVSVGAGTFTDALSNPNLAGSLIGGITLDTVGPVIANVSVSPGIYRQGYLLPIVLTMSEVVYVTGTPTMTLQINGNTRTATYWSGDKSNTLTFLYTVGSAGTGTTNDNNDVDGMQYGPINNIGTGISITDYYGNPLNPFLPSFQTQNAYVVTQPAAPPIFTLLDNTQTPSGPGSNPRATPVSTVVLTFDVPLPFENESGDLRAGYLSLEDLELTKDGNQISIVSGAGPLTVRLIPDVTSNQGRQRFEVSNFSELTKDAGTYILTFADAQIGTQSTITWVMTEATPAELTVSEIKLSPAPEDGVKPRHTEVNSITVKFSQNVFNVDRTDFKLTRDGGVDLLAGSGVVLSGSGDTYVLSGLPALTAAEGSYRLAVSETDATPIQTYAGGRLIAPKSIEWIYDREPTINSVTALGAAGTKKVGESIEFDVDFNETVFVTGVPELLLSIGDADKPARYVSGNGTNTLRFAYPVAKADEDLNGITFKSSSISIANPADNIVDQAGNAARLQFTPPSLADFLVDGVGPSVSSVTVPSAGVYAAASNLDFTVNFNDAVAIDTARGTPTLAITIGGVNRQAAYNLAASDLANGKVIFRYPVTIGDSSSGAVGSVTVGAISLGGGTIRDTNGNDATLTIPTPAPAVSGVIVNHLAATVTASADKTYKLGDVIELTAAFAQAVNVTPPASIAGTINTVTGPKPATFAYVSGSGTTALKFRYTVAKDDLDTDGIDVAGQLVGAITDAAGNAVGVSFTPPATTGIKIDAVVPAVLSLLLPPAGSYTTGDSLLFTVNFDDAVVRTGSPTLAFAISSSIRQAAYLSGDGTNALTFRYEIKAEDATANGISVAATAITLNGGTISDNAGNPGVRTIPNAPVTQPSIFVNRTVLTQVSVAPATVNNPTPTSKTYRIGDTIQFVADFSDIVTVIGTPTLALTVGTAAKTADYLTGSGTQLLTFSYLVKQGDSDSDGIEFANSVIGLAGGASITRNGSNALITFAPPSTADMRVDGSTPKLQEVIAPPNKTYVEGDKLQFVARYDEAVSVTGMPRIALLIGSTTQHATFVTGNGTATLLFEYVVQATDNDDNGIIIGTAIDINGGRIADFAGNSGTLTFTPPNTSQVRIDAARPTVTRFAVPASTLNGNYKAGAIIPITATLSEDVQAGSSIEITLDTGAIVTLSTNTVGTVLSGNYVVAQGENSADLTVSSFVDLSVTDIAGNPLGNTNLPTGTNNIGGLRAIVIDTVAPTAPNAPVEQGTTKLADGFLNIAEVATSTTFRVAFGTSGAAAGDRVELLIGAAPFSTPKIVTLVANDITNGYVDFNVSNADLSTDGNKSLTARVTDLAGNGGAAGTAITFTKDTTAPNAPNAPSEQGSTKLVDSFLNIAEAATSTTFRVSLGTSGAVAGDRVELLIGGASFSTPKIITLAAGDITNGFVNFNVSNGDLGIDGSKSLTARVSDQAANPGTAGTAITFTKDTAAPTPPNAPAEQGSSKLTDGFLNIAEAATITAFRVSLGGSDAAAGDKIELLIAGSPFSTPKIATLVGTDINNGYVDFTVSDADLGADGSKSLTARITDQAGNAGVAGSAVTFTKDTAAPTAPTAPVEQGSTKLTDGFLNIAEATTSTSFRVSLGSSGAVAGDKVEILIGGASFATPKIVTLVSGDITSGVVDFTVSSADLGADGSKSLTARLSDQAANASAASAAITFTKDTSAPNAPTLVLGPGVTDPVSRTEATQVAGVVTAAGDNGAAVTVTFTRGSNIVTRNLTATGSAQAVALSAADLATLGDGNVSVSATQIDAAGNAQTAGAATLSFNLDSVAPTVAISSNKAALRIGETATITFTLSEASTTFAVDDVVVSGGSLSGFAGTGTGYTATFTPTANSTAPGNVSIAAGRFTDAAGNDNTAGSLATPISIDTAAPTVAITSNKSALKIGETATITFTLSEASTTFATDDVVVSGGSLSGFSGTGSVYTATFTPAANSTTPGNVSVAAGRFTDAVGNDNTAGAIGSPISIDTIAPTISIASTASALRSGETATLTFTLSESSTNFASSDITVSGGTITNFTGSGASYTATFTPAAAFAGTASVSVAAGRFTDAAGNDNTVSNTVNINVDTASPTVTITSNRTALKIGETATLTFTLSENSANFTAADISATGGTISGFTGSGSNYNATFTPTAGFNGTATVSVAAGLFTDTAGNGNVASNALTIAIDTAAPAAPTLALANDTGASLTDGITSIGTFNVAGLESGATWQHSTDGVDWKNGSGTSFALGSGTYAANTILVRQIDAAGNTGPSRAYAAGVSVDNAAPTIVSITSPTRGTRTAGETIVVNATVSETVQAGSSVIVTLDTGNEVTLVAAQAGTVLTGSFVIQPGQSSTNLRVFELGLTSVGARDIAGNTLVSTVVPNSSLGATPIVIDAAVKATAAGFSNNPTVVMDKRTAVRSIPITFSTPVTGFSLANLKLMVNGRSVSLRGATLRGSGANYTLVLPAKATNLNGIYTLEIGDQGPVIRAIANGAELTTPSTIYWGKGRSIGITQSTARAAAFAASAAPKPAAKPRAAAFRTIR